MWCELFRFALLSSGILFISSQSSSLGGFPDYGYNYHHGPFNYMAGYDYYGYDMNVYGYYGDRYGGGNFYEHPGRGRSAGKYSDVV